MQDEFYGDETHLTYHETPSFSLLAMSAKLMIFNAIKSSMKLPLRLKVSITSDSILESSKAWHRALLAVLELPPEQSGSSVVVGGSFLLADGP